MARFSEELKAVEEKGGYMLPPCGKKEQLRLFWKKIIQKKWLICFPNPQSQNSYSVNKILVSLSKLLWNCDSEANKIE